jgi:hypothetical protein
MCRFLFSKNSLTTTIRPRICDCVNGHKLMADGKGRWSVVVCLSLISSTEFGLYLYIYIYIYIYERKQELNNC